jgi:hypothetical protein
MTSPLQTTTVRLPKALLAKAKSLAARKRVSLTKLIETGLQLQLAAKEVADIPLVLPICSASQQAPALSSTAPPGSETWSAGKWEAWFDENGG